MPCKIPQRQGSSLLRVAPTVFSFLLAAQALPGFSQTTAQPAPPTVPSVATPVRAADPPPSVAAPTPASQTPVTVATPAAGAQSPASVASPAASTQTPSSVATPTPIQQSPGAAATPLRMTAPYNNPADTKPVVVAPASPMTRASIASVEGYAPPAVTKIGPDHLGSPYINDDSWVYPAALRLYSLGYLDTAFIGVRPWTRRSLLHMLEASQPAIIAGNDDEAVAILASLKSYLADEKPDADPSQRGIVYGFDTGYTRLMGITGVDLRDSEHLGQTIVNDYGRPYAGGFNNLTGFSTTNEWGRFSLYLRGEYQHAPSFAGYPFLMAQQLNVTDLISTPTMAPNFVESTLPYGNTGAQNPFRIVEGAVSFHLLGHEISGGKTDSWLGPAFGGAMAWSNNAENIYSFRINRVEPLHIPLLSRLLGPVRYDFMYGSLKGHNVPNNPWVHSEIVSFKPTHNFEFAFQRTVILGGHNFPRTEPVTLHTFLKSFLSVSDTTVAEKFSRDDPGARFSNFSFSYRLPFLRNWVTLYTDSIVHDDVTPPSAPRRAAYRPGIYLSHLPGAPKFDLRVEGVSTDTSTLISLKGGSQYFESIQLQGYTNQGFIMGDWIGREAKGGQAWLTYHLNAADFIQAEFLTKETPKDFIAGAVHQNDYKLSLTRHLKPDLQLDAYYQYERWIAPVYLASVDTPYKYLGGPLYKPNAQHTSVITAQLTWYPKLHTLPSLNGK